MRRSATLFLLLISFAVSLAASIDTVAIYSPAMHNSPKAVVVLPDSYSEIDSLQLPVIYLLHGWSGSYKDWPKHIDLRALADQFQFIIVCPDGGYAGWYLDSPLDSTSQYETYISSEVVRYIDKNYRTRAQRDSRALCGLSMGGYGAVSLLSKHAETFSMAGSMSGVMDLQTAANRYSIGKLIGDFDQNMQHWQDVSCTSLVQNLKGRDVSLLIDCGVDDRFIETNRQLHKILLDLKIDHTYIERPGGHSWKYWTNALEYHLLFFKKHGL